MTDPHPFPATGQAAPTPAPVAPAPAMAPMPAAERPIEVRQVAMTIWRRRWVLILTLVASLIGGATVLERIPPEYTAYAELMLNNRQTRVVDIESVVGDLGTPDAADNELRVLTSQRLLQKVVDRLRLDRDPEFNPALRAPGTLTRGRAALAAQLPGSPLGDLIAPAPPIADPMLRAERERLEIIETFRRALKITGVPRTRALTIGVTSTDPAKAALIANTLADLYIDDQLEEKFEATRRASAWLTERIGELKTKLETSEAAIEAFKAEQTLGDGQGADLTMQQIAELNTELISARATRAEAEARVSQIQRRVRQGGIDAAANVVSSELVLALRKELSELVRQEAELSARYGDKHPRMVKVRAEIADARGAISAEVGKVIEGLRNDAAVARAREQALTRSLSELEDKSVVLARASVELRQLEREAEADRLIYQNFLNRLRETTEQEDLQAADARLLSAATPPLTPSAPSAKKVLVVSGVLGLALGFGLIVLLERVDRSFRSAAEIEEATGLPVLAALPERPSRHRRALLEHVIKRPNGALAEAVRSLRTALALGLGLGTGAAGPKVVMVTSALPGEGKSTTALLLAQMAAQANRKAIVVDCDLRRPSVQRTFGLGRRPGLTAVLDGALTEADAILHDQATGIDVLASPQPEATAAERLSAPAFEALIGDLRQRYDLVVLDTPPILAVSDAAVVGRVADRALFCVRWADTARGAVQQGLARLAAFGLMPSGIVMTQVDLRREAAYADAAGGYGYDAGVAGYCR